jgi:hypothetical protein
MEVSDVSFGGVLVASVHQFVTLIGRRLFAGSCTSSANRLLENQVWETTGDHRMLGSPNLFRRG